MASDSGDAKKSEAYTETMKAKMGSSLTYKHEDGMNYAVPLRRIIIGSCLQTPEDVDTLKKEGVGIVFCLQQDADLNHFSIDIGAIERRAAEVGITHIRNPIRDFDPLALRRHLPDAVGRLAAEMAARPNDLVYIHCTAGLGRAPGLALAYMFWVDGACLDAAYAELFEVRRCHPQLGMIRAATCDILSGGEGGLVQTRLAIRRPQAKEVFIAGLDVGWHNKLPLEKEASSDEFVLLRDLPPGRFQYKFIVDGEWLPNMDLPTVDDNGNINNVCEVDPEPGTPEAERRSRLMAPKGLPTPEELRQLRARVLGAAASSPTAPAS